MNKKKNFPKEIHLFIFYFLFCILYFKMDIVTFVIK